MIKKNLITVWLRQLSLLDKAILADYAIMNNGTLSDLQQVTKELYQELLED